MDLWIKLAANAIYGGSLVKVDNVIIKQETYDNPKTIWWKIITCKSSFHNEDYLILGKYKTKERALEVINEIQKLLIGQNKLIMTNIETFEEAEFAHKTSEEKGSLPICGDADIKYISANVVVYEMPKE